MLGWMQPTASGVDGMEAVLAAFNAPTQLPLLQNVPTPTEAGPAISGQHLQASNASIVLPYILMKMSITITRCNVLAKGLYDWNDYHNASTLSVSVVRSFSHLTLLQNDCSLPSCSSSKTDKVR